MAPNGDYGCASSPDSPEWLAEEFRQMTLQDKSDATAAESSQLGSQLEARRKEFEAAERKRMIRQGIVQLKPGEQDPDEVEYEIIDDEMTNSVSLSLDPPKPGLWTRIRMMRNFGTSGNSTANKR